MEAFIIVFLIFAGMFLLLRQENKRKIEYNNHKNEQIESVTALDRGTWSERDLVYELLEHGIAPGAIFHDLYVKKANGRHAQIDLVVATKVGLIVFEVKDYSGWIFGRGNQDKWTQVLAYGRDKYRFYNPIKQNAGHIAELQKQSKQMSEIPMFSVVVFYGGCTLRDVSIIPHNTYVTTWRRALDVVDTILEENEPANYTDKHEIVRILKAAVENGAKENMTEQHADSVEAVDRGLDSFTTNLVVAATSRGRGSVCLAITPAKSDCVSMMICIGYQSTTCQRIHNYQQI